MPKLETLSDNFNDNSIDSGLWTTDTSGSTITETGQQYIITHPDPSVSSYGDTYSANLYDATDSYVFLSILEVPSSSTAYSSPAIITPDFNNSVDFTINNGTLYARYDGTSQYTTTYDSTTHKWLRIRESSGTVYWDVSSNGASWTNVASLSTPFDMSSVYFTIFCNIGISLGTNRVIVDNVNAINGTNTAWLRA